ncbi:kinase-like domain-containing protein [Rhizophagus irregularis DAOM 181602=DAOM 197198]|nr:kinase-like domain-containing protein [Rhizophagus irregularis DAOM 181602=DAOM 197198]
MSAEYLNEIKILWDLCQIDISYLMFYGMTKDPETEELIIISQYADKGNLRSVLLHNFNNILPTAGELCDIIQFLSYSSYTCNNVDQEKEKFGYKGKEIKAINLTKPVNSSIITDYLNDEENNKDCQDSQLFDLEISSSLQLKDDINNKEG